MKPGALLYKVLRANNLRFNCETVRGVFGPVPSEAGPSSIVCRALIGASRPAGLLAQHLARAE